MTDMTTLVPALKREVAPPGQFDTQYPNSTDEELAAYLMDGLAFAQLEGYLLDIDGDPEAFETTPDLSAGGSALVVMYSAERILTNYILNLRMALRVAAGPVKYETEQSANVATEVLKQLQARRERVTEAATGVGGGSTTAVLSRDQYLERVLVGWPAMYVLPAGYGGYYSHDFVESWP